MELFSIVGAIVLSLLASGVLTWILLQKARSSMETDLSAYQNDISKHIGATLEAIKNDLAPVIENNKRAFSTMGTIGSRVKAENQAIEILGSDLIDQNELLLSGIETISPRFADHLRENPEQIVTLMPRIQAIADKMGLDLSQYLPNPSPSSPRPHQPHPFGNSEI